MNSKSEIKEPEDSVDEVQADNSPSVDDFIKELEAKEKDLHITADYQIEISDSDFDTGTIPGFVQPELPAPVHTPTTVAAAPTAGSKTRIFELEKEISSLQDRIAGLRLERNEIQEKSDRRLKDFENYKYRMDRERRGAFINQIGNLASQMLPVLDNLDRAIDSINELAEEKRDEFRQFFDGIALVNQQINEVFAEMGVQPVATIGELFDPNLHEAVATEERTDLPPNTISAEMLRGYRIGNKVIRHSMVKVTSAPPAPKKEVKITPEEEAPISSAIEEPTDVLPDDKSLDLE